MTREEELDWLYRLRSEIYVYMPKEWLIPMNNALDMAIKALEQESTTKNCESCEFYGLHHDVCNYCCKCSLWAEKEPTTKNDLGVDENPTKKYCGCCKHWKIKGVQKIGDKPTSYGKCTKLSISGFEVETTFNDDCSLEGLK